jgi:hypothetical protein
MKVEPWVEQTSELIKAPNSTIQRLVNAIVGAMKINSQEITRSSAAPRSIYANEQRRIGSPNFGGIFFQGAKKNCCQTKMLT